MKLRPFQKKFIRNAFRPGVDTGVLSLPRGNGKSFLGSHLLARCLTPGDDLHVAGKEYVQVASSLEQARIVYHFVRSELEGSKDYRFLDSSTRVGITHKPTNTRLRVLSSKAKSAFGLVGVPLLIFDEPGALETVGGTMLSDAVFSSQGKPTSTLRVILTGTVAPSTEGWWADLVVAGTKGSVYVMALQGNAKKWDSWPEIRRCNPLTSISAPFRKKLLSERDAAKRDSRLKARFCSYRLNLPSADESTTLLTTSDFEGMTKRAVPPRIGKPIVAVDLGGSRAWSAAVSLWANGVLSCLAVCPGIPSIEDQEITRSSPEGDVQGALGSRGAACCRLDVAFPRRSC